MNLEDLIKLAGVTKSPYDTPVQEQPTEIEEQPVMDDNEGMRALIALVTPEQLNQLQGQAPVEEEGFANSGDEYAGEPEEFKGTLGSPADLSLRRYLGANGVPVNVDETKVYEDHKLEDLNEAWKAYKLEERPSDLANMLKTFRTGPKPTMGEPVPGIREPGKPPKMPTPGGGPEEPPSMPSEPIPEPRPTPKPTPIPGGGPEEPPTPTPGEPIPEPTPTPDPEPTPGGGPEEPPTPTPGEPIPEPREPGEPTPTPGGGPEEPPAPPVGEPVPEPTPEPTPIPTPGGGPEAPPKAPEAPEPDKAPEAPKAEKPKAPRITPQMRKDAEEYADRDGLPRDQLGTIVSGTVGGIPTTLEVDPNSGTVIDTKTGDVIGGDDAEAAREAAKGKTPGLGKKDESLERLLTLSGINESYTMMERPSDRSRRGTRPPDAIGKPMPTPGGGPSIGEPIPEPREPKPPMPTPGGGPEEPPSMPGFDPDPDFPDEPDEPPGILDDPTTKIPQIPMSTKIDPKDIDGDSPAEPDQGKDVFGRDKAALAKKDAIFKKYGLTPPASALFQSADLNEEPNEGNEFTGELAKAKAAGKKEFSVAGKTYKVESTQQVDEGGMKQAEIEVQDWVEKYDDFMGVNGDSLPEGYLQAMLNSGIMSDAFDQDEYIAFNKKNGYEDDGDWQEGDHQKFMMSSPNTKGMFDEIRAIQDKYGIDEQEVNDIMGYFESKKESINDLRKLAGI